jgi:hypothetical protein
VRLEGSIDAFSLPDIFSLLSMTKKTGGLHLRRAGAHGVVWLADGVLTGGTSDLGRQSLGRRIAGSGHVADDALAAAVDKVGQDGGLGLARSLRDAGAIDEGDLHSMVREHVADVVFDLMRWSDGDFEFVVDEANTDDVGITREVDEVVTEARRRLEIWAGIDAKVATTQTVLSLAMDPRNDPQLSRDEWALLALVDGRRTVGELVAMCGRGEYSVVVALAELVSRDLLRAEDSEGVAALIRRQEVLASLETRSPRPRASATVAPAVDPAPSAPAVHAEPEAAPLSGPTLVPDRASTDDDSPAEQYAEAADHEAAEVSSLSRGASIAQDLHAVIPQRPEPFVTPREPEHPEPLAAAAGGGAVAAPAVAAAIERDPSVNKSLLLRLIAGVRGL